MSSSTGKVKKLVEDFKENLKSLEKDQANKSLQDKCSSCLTKLKITLLEFDVSSALEDDKKLAKEQLTLSREALELATFYSVTVSDIGSFKRHIAQVQMYYRDYSSILLESPRKWTILGLNLMYLLAYNQLSKFHTELEMIPMEARKETYVAYPIEVEQRLMEGSYSKVRNLRKTVPSAYYAIFMDTLVETVRERISECSTAAYETIPLADGKKMFLLDSDQKIKEYAIKQGWEIKNAAIYMNKNSETKEELKSRELIKESLGFATELERIV
mmetsp:Transcript_11413/g.15994  ORF Transcript_11413/g.15994 Transcript_11413/m.15994 type:complete len:272 (-) Transcript_11413:260-1075(-)